MTQKHKTHPADDDGIWWFRRPHIPKEIQIESSPGNCPFLIEHDDMNSAVETIAAANIQEIVETIVNYCQSGG